MDEVIEAVAPQAEVDCRTELDNEVNEPEMEDVIEAVEHPVVVEDEVIEAVAPQAVVDCRMKLDNKVNEPEMEEVIEAVEHPVVVDVRSVPQSERV